MTQTLDEPSFPWTVTSDGLVLAVRVTPRSSRDDVSGVVRDGDQKLWLRVRVTAVPEDGKANAALLKFLAKRLKLAKRHIELISGETSRSKRLSLKGDSTELAARIVALIGDKGLEEHDGDSD